MSCSKSSKKRSQSNILSFITTKKNEIKNDNGSTSIKSLEDKCGSKSSDGGSLETSGSVNSPLDLGLYIGCGKQVSVYFYLNIFLNNLIIYSI